VIVHKDLPLYCRPGDNGYLLEKHMHSTIAKVRDALNSLEETERRFADQKARYYERLEDKIEIMRLRRDLRDMRGE
jgi:hypothetical protein